MTGTQSTMMAACDKEYSITPNSHNCGYPTKAGTPCKRLGSGASGYCWQHK